MPEEERGPLKSLVTAIEAGLLGVAVTLVWGVGVAVPRVHQAGNTFWRAAAVLLLSAVVSLPAAALTWRMSGTPGRTVELVRSFFLGVLGGGLVLAVISPIVGLYYFSSSVVGPLIAQASVLAALLVGGVVFVRAVMASRDKAVKRRRYFWPLTAAITLFSLAVLQFVAALSPILPERTVFDRGVDGIVKGR